MNLTPILSLFLLNMLVSGQRISQEKCAEYKKMFPANYYETGEEDAAPREFPFMAKVENTTLYHNGILVSENFVLSVAYTHLPDTSIVLGDLEIHTDRDDSRPKTYKVIKWFQHPDFDRAYVFADLILYQLNESVKFSNYVRPACLSFNELSVDLRMIGWGSTNVRSNDVLHKISSKHISNKRCRDLYQKGGRQKYVADIEKGAFFCAESENGSRQLVYGSGSAVINDDRNAPNEVIGLLADTLKTEEVNVTVSVRVSAYIDWIERTVWPNHSTSAAENKNGTKNYPMKFVYLIIATISLTLVLSAAIVYFLLLRSKARKNTVRLQLNQDNNTVQVESILQ